jgi:hypothetical protein
MLKRYPAVTVSGIPENLQGVARVGIEGRKV